MEQHYLTGEQIAAFASHLVRAERTPATIEKYLRSVRAFFLYLDGRPVRAKIQVFTDSFWPLDTGFGQQHGLEGTKPTPPMAALTQA